LDKPLRPTAIEHHLLQFILLGDRGKVCEQLAYVAYGFHLTVEWPGVKPATFKMPV